MFGVWGPVYHLKIHRENVYVCLIIIHSCSFIIGEAFYVLSFFLHILAQDSHTFNLLKRLFSCVCLLIIYPLLFVQAADAKKTKKAATGTKRKAASMLDRVIAEGKVFFFDDS